MKKFRILSTAFLCAAFAVTAFLGARAYNANASTSTFAMKTGASIRIPTEETDMTQNDNGLRFTATISAAEYEGYAQDGTVTVGTFIMPKAYETKYGELNEDNLFGANAKYKWENGNVTVNGDVVGAKKIIHVKANAYKADEEDDFYTINGSVLHILDENLDLEFIGRSYIRIDGEGDPTIIFAAQTSANARSVIKVAESAILNEDPAITDAAVAARVEAAYNDRYVEAYKAANGGLYPTVKATVTVKKDISSDSGYVTDETLSYESTVEYKGIGEKATGKEYAIDVTDYAYAVGLDEEKVVTLDGAEFTLNYNYVANRAQIIGFDTEEERNLWETGSYNFSTYQRTNITAILDGGGVFQARTDGKDTCEVSNEWSYEGGYSLKMLRTESWDGPVWKQAVVLPFKTNKLSAYIKGGVLDEEKSLETEVYTRKGGRVFVVTSSNITVPARGEAARKNIITLGEEIDNVICVLFKTDVNTHYYVDNICAEKELYVGGAPDGYFQTGIEFNAELKSTSLFPSEIAALGETAVSYSADGETWNTLAKADGKYTVPVDNAVNNYYVKMTNVSTEEVYLEKTVKRGFLWASFDEARPHYVAVSGDYVAGNVFAYNMSNRSTIEKEEELKIDEGAKMKYTGSWQYVTHYELEDGQYKVRSVNLGATFRKLAFYIYVDTDTEVTTLNNFIWINGFGSGYFPVDIAGRQQQVVRVEIDLGKDFSSFTSIAFNHSGKTIYIDTIELLPA